MKKTQITFSCEYCHKPITTCPSRKRRFCSQKCNANFLRLPIARCPTCGKEFYKWGSKQRFCSGKCVVRLKPIISKEALFFLYVLQELSIMEIASLTASDQSHISKCLDLFRIEKRGYKRTARYRQHMAATKKQRWSQDKNLRERTVAAIMKGRAARPNKPERLLTELMEKNKLPFKYTGDGSVVISGLCPDFVNTDGQKEIIELFGDFWHSKRSERNLRPTQTEHGRGAIFRKFGFRTLVIWEHELANQEAVIARIRRFSNSKEK